MNDSFVFLHMREVQKMWSQMYGHVLGLVWTGNYDGDVRFIEEDSKTGLTARVHIQSYMRSLSPDGALAYLEHCHRERNAVKQLSGASDSLIAKFEMDLHWSPGPISALFDAPTKGGHPDAEESMIELIKKGYPAVKLKKFHEPDRCFGADGATRSGLPRGFSVDVYREKNHDLRHLSDKELENHFVLYGFAESRVYCYGTRKWKSWLREYLVKEGLLSSMAILDLYLDVLNSNLLALYSAASHRTATTGAGA